ncbi:hypothetical protein [Cellulomonas sp. Root137]|uniref:hypothetical protein n=1 Tax=Cellulomonas sp. Root137 TaxID=1736459 RepID=UPI0006FC3FF6|nr:hypothetical protein [Cellulomonas sp. Root137]KQY47973.1 hypothetical protein ASD18_12160 [Cellulomonas sp. Root137]
MPGSLERRLKESIDDYACGLAAVDWPKLGEADRGATVDESAVGPLELAASSAASIASNVRSIPIASGTPRLSLCVASLAA